MVTFPSGHQSKCSRCYSTRAGEASPLLSTAPPRSLADPPATPSTPALSRPSSDLWVYETGTGADQPEWDATASSTSVTDPVIPWSIQYGKGEQEGFLNQDMVELGGYEAETVFASANTLNQVSRLD